MSSHERCPKKPCANCMKDAISKGLPPVTTCVATTEVFTQIDQAFPYINLCKAVFYVDIGLVKLAHDTYHGTP